MAKAHSIPWGDGPHIWPGRKFDEVEFIVVLAVGVRGWRVKVKGLGGKEKRM